jgi:hypothetical protein
MGGNEGVYSMLVVNWGFEWMLIAAAISNRRTGLGSMQVAGRHPAMGWHIDIIQDATICMASKPPYQLHDERSLDCNCAVG